MSILVSQKCVVCGHTVKRPARHAARHPIAVCTENSCALWKHDHERCFREMRRRLQTDARNPSPGYIDTQGYRRVLKPDHPRADRRGYVRQAWLVVEEHRGRHLERWEQVRFRDGDHSNLSIDNLVVVVVPGLRDKTGW